MLKFYDCKVCETPCIGMPFDGEIYDKEVCSPECLAQLEAAEHHAHQTPETQAKPQAESNAEASEPSDSVPQSAQAQVA